MQAATLAPPTARYEARVLERLPGMTIVQHVEPDGTVWATRRRTVLVRREGRWQSVARFPRVWPRDAFGWSRPTARAMRSDKANVYVNRHGRVLGIRGGTAWRLDGQRLTELSRLQGDCVLHRGICEDPDGQVYFGEYFMNPARGPVRVWRCAADLRSAEVAYEFPAGSIRHVHGVYRDPCDPSALWLTAGDYQNECYLFRTDSRFRTLERYGDGTQIYRAVTLLFTPEHVSWITDSHIEQNHACRMRRSDGELEVGQKVACSAWYGATMREGLQVMFTTVEKGPAIQRQEASLLVSDDGFRWSEARAFRKDWWRPLRVFKYGVVSLPSGNLSGEDFYVSGEGLVGLDGSSLRMAVCRLGEV